MSTIPLMAPADLGNLREIFEVQRARFRTAPHATAAQRRAKLAALEHAIGKRRREIAAALFADLHKAPAESEFTEIIPTLTEVRYARRNVETWMRPEPVPTPRTLLGARCEVRREPKGVVLILAPWNYPLYLSLGPLVAAIAAGNRAIVRPSEKAPHTARVIEAIVRGAFAPEEVAFAGGGIETANALLEFPFDHIFFTGSTRVGKLVMRAAAEHLAGVTLELGGKSPAVVAEDADLGLAAQRIAWGKFMNAGQTCVAPDYVLVPQARERDFIERTGKAMANMFGKNAARRARTANFGRIVDDAAFDRLTAMLDGSIAGGARIDVGGERSRADRYIAPTIVSNLGFDSPLMAEEIFGPILPVLTYRTTGEALAAINARPKPLALYAFGSRAATNAIVAGTSAGGSAINDVVLQLANPNLPFGGIGESGVGNYHGIFGFRALSHERAVLRGAKRSAATWYYPPYTRVTDALLRMLDRIA